VKTVLVNFADRAFQRSQALNSASGLEVGGFDRVFSYSPRDIDRVFRRRNAAVLKRRRGAGNWLWKPYFIRRTLDAVGSNDVVFYCDSGAVFIDSARPLIDLAVGRAGGVLLFELQNVERAWTKRDAFVILGCDEPWYHESPQRMATFSVWRKDREATTLVEEWLEGCQDERVLTDSPNMCGRPNLEGFVEHRFDQSVLSLLSKRAGVPAYRDPSQWGNALRLEYPESRYGQVIDLTRHRTPTLLDRAAMLRKATASFARTWRHSGDRRRGS